MILSFHQLRKEVKEMEVHEDINLEAVTVNVDATNSEEFYPAQSKSSASANFGCGH
ncbi:hypothetical protein RV14_GL001831 [Enterococcus ratti]|uniref:Uncharacterized protein n=2 Tax=Enterococcus ratti TaxID=150033 RepID=A0A1L8WQ64_9ENTE|nr:hypothetical protein RV14_GL001831 [Enterococcus ratti]